MSDDTSRTGSVETVVKLGGGVLGYPELLHDAALAIAAGARERRLLVVPGGGPFADAVREADRRHGLSVDAAHWMAVLAMDQVAHLLADRLPGGAVVTAANEIAAVLGAGQVPVLAPSRWLLESDPLPHGWDVTSDSIAAWVSGRVGARQLVLVKPPGVDPLGASGSLQGELVDGHFRRALPETVAWTIIAADQVETLPQAVCRPAQL